MQAVTHLCTPMHPCAHARSYAHAGAAGASASTQLMARVGCPLHAVDIVSEGCIAVGGRDSLCRVYTLDRHFARELRKASKRRRD